MQQPTEMPLIQQLNNVFFIFDEERILSVISHTAVLLTWLLIQVILVAIIFVLYILTTKKCCVTSSTSRDLRISIILITIADLNIIISIALLFSHTSMHIIPLVPLAIVAIGQLILFVLFASSSKVMDCCTCTHKEDVIQPIHYKI